MIYSDDDFLIPGVGDAVGAFNFVFATALLSLTSAVAVTSRLREEACWPLSELGVGSLLAVTICRWLVGIVYEFILDSKRRSRAKRLDFCLLRPFAVISVSFLFK